MYNIIIKNYFDDKILDQYKSKIKLEYSFKDLYVSRENKRYLVISTKRYVDDITIYVVGKNKF
jgi:hypothetical protein